MRSLAIFQLPVGYVCEVATWPLCQYFFFYVGSKFPTLVLNLTRLRKISVFSLFLVFFVYSAQKFFGLYLIEFMPDGVASYCDFR